MSFPIRCFTCNKVVASFEQKYNDLIVSGSSPKEALDIIGMTRYCCRRMFLGYVNIIDQLLLIPKDIPNPSEKKLENTRE
jgi:DNA-directed RNA polymerase subunit N (RpoN/RPB10)